MFLYNGVPGFMLFFFWQLIVPGVYVTARVQLLPGGRVQNVGLFQLYGAVFALTCGILLNFEPVAPHPWPIGAKKRFGLAPGLILPFLPAESKAECAKKAHSALFLYLLLCFIEPKSR